MYIGIFVEKTTVVFFFARTCFWTKIKSSKKIIEIGIGRLLLAEN